MKQNAAAHSPKTGGRGGQKPCTIDLGKIYQFSPDDIVTDIGVSSYSNLAYIQCTQRDVMIDFLEMPGIKGDDGKVRVKGTRIYMSHAAGESLARTLGDILEKTYANGQMEEYSSVHGKLVKTAVNRSRGKNKESIEK